MISSGNTFLMKVRKHKTLILMAMPAILFCLVFSYLPMFGIIVAFKNYNYTDGIIFSPWAGFDNFRFFFISGKAWNVTINTILYNILFIGLGMITQITVAILIAEMKGKIFKKTCQSLMFLPYFISWVVASAFMYNIFNVDTGFLNSTLEQLNMDKVNIYNEPVYWYFIMPLLNSWKYTGYGSVLYLAAIMGFDVECYEAATIDGANRFQKIFNITLPLLKPTIIILLLLSLGRILRGDFDMFYQIIGQNSILYNATDIVDTFVFRSLVENGDMSMTAAASFYQSVLCLIIIVLTNSIVRKYQKDYALF